MATSVYSRTLQKAALLIGGRAKLCRHLQVPIEELEKWIEDKKAPPIAVFLKAVDLVIAETAAPGESDSGGGQPPRDCSPAEGPAALC